MSDAPATIRHPLPERLETWLRGPGFEGALSVARADGEAMSVEDVARLDASLALYEERDVEAPTNTDAFEIPEDEDDEATS